MTSLRGGCQQSFNGMLVRPRIHHMFVLRGDDTVALTGFILEDGAVDDLTAPRVLMTAPASSKTDSVIVIPARRTPKIIAN